MMYKYRDRFPKASLDKSYLGDTYYPLCSELPPRPFLAPGARFEYTGENSLEGPLFDTDDYAPQLLTSEYQRGGVFAAMSAWLDDQISADNAEGFYKPYDVDRGGVAPEPWHISYRPVAQGYCRQLSLSQCLPLWRGYADPAGQCHAPLQMVSLLETEAEAIFKRYVLMT